MKISKLRLKDFGKFQELELKFGPKLNVIFGANEAGKSTVISFIKAMFYGMNSRKRELRENDRLRFQPWHGDFGEGELFFQDEAGREILLRRKLENERRDNLYLCDVGTGRRVADAEGTTPGERFFGLSEAAFMRTIYVPQLGCAVSADKEDEIMARLMNLQQTGQEEVSLQKAITLLEKERKKISLRSGNGKLDNLRSLQQELRQEREEVRKLYQENIADQLALNELKEKKEQFLQRITQLEEKRVYLKKRKQYLEYRELENAAEVLENLRDEAQKMEAELLCGDRQVDQLFLQEVGEQITEERQQAKLAREIAEESTAKEQTLAEGEAKLLTFQGFTALEDNVGAQVLLKAQEEKNLTEKLAKLDKQQQEKAQLEAQLREKKAGWGNLAVFAELTPAEEEEITKKEAEKQQYAEKLSQEQQIDYLRREFVSDKLKRAQDRFRISLVVAAAGLIGGLIIHPLIYLVALGGLIASAFAFPQIKKHQLTLAEIEAQLSAHGDKEILTKMYEKVQAELTELYQRYGVADQQEFNLMRRKFEALQSELGIIEATIFDRTEQLKEENEEALRKQWQECHGYLAKVFELTDSDSVEEVQEKWDSFLEYKQEQEKKKVELCNLQNKLQKIEAQREELAKAVSKQLRLEKEKMGADCQVMARAEQFLRKYQQLLTRKSEVAVRIEAEEQNLAQRLAGRSLSELAAAVAGFVDQAEEVLAEEVKEGDGIIEAKEEEKIEKKEEAEEDVEKEIKEDAKENVAEEVKAEVEEEAKEEVKAEVGEDTEEGTGVLLAHRAETEETLELCLKKLREERLAAEKEFTGIESRIASRFRDVREIARIEEELVLVAQQAQAYEESLEALELTKSVLLEAFEELQNSFGPQLNHQVGQILQLISAGKYAHVQVTNNYQIKLKKEETDWERELGFFSNGTLDQVYFALRLGIIALAYEKEHKLPLILDDTFVQYDDERLTAVLEYLLTYAEQHQVLLFTCHSREAKVLSNREFTYLTLEN